MRIVEKVDELRLLVEKQRFEYKKIGFVPTMGALHEGHLSLVKKARTENDFVVVSIFVNPIQFSENEDYGTYIADLSGDTTLLETEGVDILFVPKVDEMYVNRLTSVSVKGMEGLLCGVHRGSHFSGVATIVLKLFNMVTPHRAYFGEKDYQQLQLIKKMVFDLNLPIEIVSSEIVREEDGLAFSTRNRYLSSKERERAVYIAKSFNMARDLVQGGETDSNVIEEKVMVNLERHGVQVEYVSICDADTLENVKNIADDARIFVAARIGSTRLIDNTALRG